MPLGVAREAGRCARRYWDEHDGVRAPKRARYATGEYHHGQRPGGWLDATVPVLRGVASA